ncbi:hypothetical protein L9F63_011963, partial [Diploptera punctata]
MINYDMGRGVRVRHGRYSSELVVTEAHKHDSGNYSCVPSNAQPASISVHILNGGPLATVPVEPIGIVDGPGAEALELAVPVIKFGSVSTENLLCTGTAGSLGTIVIWLLCLAPGSPYISRISPPPAMQNIQHSSLNQPRNSVNNDGLDRRGDLDAGCMFIAAMWPVR